MPCLVLDDKQAIVRALCLHQVLFNSKAEIDQFSEGLAALGTLHAIKTYPELLEHFFVRPDHLSLTSGIILKHACMHHSHMDHDCSFKNYIIAGPI